MRIGETFQFCHHTLRVEPAKEERLGCCVCDGCFFYERNLDCMNGYVCTASARTDGQNVIFVDTTGRTDEEKEVNVWL